MHTSSTHACPSGHGTHAPSEQVSHSPHNGTTAPSTHCSHTPYTGTHSPSRHSEHPSQGGLHSHGGSSGHCPSQSGVAYCPPDMTRWHSTISLPQLSTPVVTHAYSRTRQQQARTSRPPTASKAPPTLRRLMGHVAGQSDTGMVLEVSLETTHAPMVLYVTTIPTPSL